MGGKGEFAIDPKDEVVRGSIVLQDGKMMWPPPAIEMPAPSPSKPKEIVKPPEQTPLAAAAWESGLTASMNQMINSYEEIYTKLILYTGISTTCTCTQK